MRSVLRGARRGWYSPAPSVRSTPPHLRSPRSVAPDLAHCFRPHRCEREQAMTPPESSHWIEWRSTRRPLVDGASVTIGRSPRCDVVLPAEDDFVSRRAVTVVVARDHVEVVNTSDKRELRLRPPVGEDVVVRPLGSATNRGMPAFSIVLAGLRGEEYLIEVKGPSGESEEARSTVLGDATLARPFPLTAAETAVVVALCRPMLVGNGAAAVPSTYAEIGRDLGLQPGYVRNVVRRVRDRLTDAGVPGLEAGQGDGAADFRLPLARYAIQVGWAFGDD